MVVIRLSRAGTKKKPFYHLAVADKQSPRDGRFIERVGFYNPIARGKSEPLRVDLERVDYWLSVGAQLSPKVKSIVARARILDALPPEPAPTDSTDTSSMEAKDEVAIVAEEDRSETTEETSDAGVATEDSQEPEGVTDQEVSAEPAEVDLTGDTVNQATEESKSVEPTMDAKTAERDAESHIDIEETIDQEESSKPEATTDSADTGTVEEVTVEASDESKAEDSTEEVVRSEETTESSTASEVEDSEDQDEEEIAVVDATDES